MAERKSKASSDGTHKRYTLLDKIGRGGFGFVYRARDEETGRIVAAKLIDLEEAGDEMEEVQQEIAVMSNSHCPQLTEYYTSFVSDNQLWIIMEHLEAGSLSDVMKEFGPLGEASIAYVMRELLTALAYLHAGRKIHRDIKAGNILVSGTGLVKLSDFGVTGQLTDSMNKRKTRVGTPFWMAPEVITETSYDSKADIWSVGITAIELAKGFPPHAKSIHPMQVIFLIPKNPPPVLEGDYSANFKDFVSKCLCKDPTCRPASADLLQHPFLEGAALTEELREWARSRQAHQRNQLEFFSQKKDKRSFGSPAAQEQNQMIKKLSSRGLTPSADSVNVSELQTLDAGKHLGRPITSSAHFVYTGDAALSQPHVSMPMKKAVTPPARGGSRDPLAAALAAANAAAALAVAGGNPGLSPRISPRSEHDMANNHSMDSGGDNTSGWDFDLTIKTRTSTGSAYSYSYSAKNFPDLELADGGIHSLRHRSHGNMSSPLRAFRDSETDLLLRVRRALSGDSTGPSVTITEDGKDEKAPAGGSIDFSDRNYDGKEVDKADPTMRSAEVADEKEPPIVIDESTVTRYMEMDPPMTDGEAFSAVFGVLSRFKWQFLDRSPSVEDLSPHFDATQLKQIKRKYKKYVKQLDACVADNPGGVEYSRDTPLRPSGLFRDVVLPAMGSVGSSAAVALGSELQGGSGLRGVLGSSAGSVGNADITLGHLPIVPISCCGVVDFARDSTVAYSSPQMRLAIDDVSQPPATTVSNSKSHSNANTYASIKSNSSCFENVLSGCLEDSTISEQDRYNRLESGVASKTTSKTTSNGDIYESADTLLNHLCNNHSTSVGNVDNNTVSAIEHRRERESRAILWALERCLLALDIQSGGGATTEVLSTLMGYMIEGVDEQAEV